MVLLAVVVQGRVRDTDAVESLGCPVWSTHILSIHPDKCGHGMVNAPVVCDGVLVNPGDLIVTDADGVIGVPKADAPAAVKAALARMRKEEERAEAVARGETVWDLGGSAASYAKMHIEEIDGTFDDLR